MKKLLLFLPLLFLLCTSKTFATSPDLSLEINYPDNQINKEVSYFDLEILPNLKQDLSLTIKNQSTKTKDLDLEVTNAYTTMNGDIDYSLSNTDKKLSAPVTLKQLLVLDNPSVRVEVHSEKKVQLHLSIPPHLDNGTILGGIMVKEKQEQDKKTDQKNSIGNEFAYVKGVKLNYKKEPLLKLEASNARLSNIQSQPVVLFELKNLEATLGKKVQVTSKVISIKNNKEYANKEENIDLAPFSVVNLPIKISEPTLPVGKYKLVLNITHKEYKFEKTLFFDVNQKEKIENQKKEANSYQYIPQWLIIGFVILGIITLLMILLVIKSSIKKRKS